MRRSAILPAVLATVLGFTSVSTFAQGWRDRDRDGRNDRFEQRDGRHDGHRHGHGPRQEWRDDHRNDWRRDHRDHWRGDHRHYSGPPPQVRVVPNYGYAGNGYSGVYVQPAPIYSRPAYSHYYRPAPYYAPPVRYISSGPRYYYQGDVLPWEYRRNMVVVNDWHAYNLYAPPVGYHWVRSDAGDFLLVALATGIIASLLTR